MASDQDIANGVASLLRQYDPNAVPSLSVNGVVQQLEAKLGLDLSDRAPFIRELILRFHQKDHFTLHHPPQFPNSQPNPLPHPHHPHHPHHHHHNPPPSIPSNPFPPSPLHHHELAFRCPPQQQQPQPQPPQQQQQQQQQQPQPSQQQTQPSVSVAVAAAAAPAASVPESPKEREKEREMVSNQDIANGVASLLRQYDPNAVPSLSVNSVVQQLEAKLGLDLSDRAPFIRELILRFHQKDHFTLHHPPQFPNSHPNPRPHHHHNPPSIPSNPFPPPPLHLHELAFQCPPQQQPQPQPSQPQQQQQQPQPSQQQTQPSVAVSMAAAPAASVPESPKESTQSGGKRRGGPGGLNKVCGVSPQLQTIVGAPTMPRTEIVKQLWAYIRKNNLQDPSNKRKIICDDPLRLVFETDCTDMFKMNKLLAKHIIPLDPKGPDAKRLKATDVESAPQHTEPGPSPIVISDMLAKFFGTGEREMLQSEAVRRVWEYIKVNHLEFQDPMNMNGMIVRCDIKLQGLFGCESLPAMRISEMLMRHHFFRQS